MGAVLASRHTRPRVAFAAICLVLAGCGRSPDAVSTRDLGGPDLAATVPTDHVTIAEVTVGDVTSQTVASTTPGTPPVEPAASAFVDVGDLTVELELHVPTITSDRTPAAFFSSIELRSGTVIAAGADIDPATGTGDAAALWRSVDGAASFERVGLEVASDVQIEHIRALAHEDGTTYAFVNTEVIGGMVSVWSSPDDGVSWSEQLIGGGALSWGGIVSGVPTVAVQEITADAGQLAILQRRNGEWVPSQVPPTGDWATVSDVATLPNGVVLAVGARCDTDPGATAGADACSADRPDAPRDSLALVSRDGGATWSNESEWLGGAPQSQFTSAVTVIGDEALIGITGSTLQGDAYTIVFNSTTDGPSWGGFGTMPSWDGGSTPVHVESISALGDDVVALVTSSAQGDRESGSYLFVHDRSTGEQRLVDLEGTLPLAGAFELTTVGDLAHLVGAATVNDVTAPAIVVLRPAG